MKLSILLLPLLAFLPPTPWAQSGQGSAPSSTAIAAPGMAISRPPIVGVAYVALRTDNMEAARKFYTAVLGFHEPFTINRWAEEGGGLTVTYFRVNDRQYISMLPKLTDPKMDRLSHISFETTNAEQLRAYLASKHVPVPEKLDRLPDGNVGFRVMDPDGHAIKFVQFMPGSLHTRNFGKTRRDTRVSKHILHVGLVIKDRNAADHFYRDILGFKEIWHGGMKDKDTDWVDMRVPDGTDWLEYMLNVHDPDPRELGVMHHFALSVPDVKTGYKTAVARGYRASETPHIGRDGKWQFNLYDPNFTRVELMEPKPVKKPCCSPMLP